MAAGRRHRLRNQFHSVGLAVYKTEKEDDFVFIFESVRIGISKISLKTVYANLMTGTS